MMREMSTSTSAAGVGSTPKDKSSSNGVVNLGETSPGKGYWKRQIAHISAHLEAFTQRDAEFRADVGKPKLGKVRFVTV